MCYLACFWHDFRSNFKDSALQTSYPMFLGHIYKLLELDKLITIANTQLHFLSIFITKVCPKMLQRREIKTKTSSGILSYVPSSLFFFVCVILCAFGTISGVTSKIQHCRLPTQCSWAIYCRSCEKIVYAENFSISNWNASRVFSASRPALFASVLRSSLVSL